MSITLTSGIGDPIGQGRNYSYSQANALITVTSNGALLSVRIEGDETWTGEFQLPNMYTTLEVGTYNNLTSYPFHDDLVGGLNWWGEGRGCSQLNGSIVIESVTYDGTALTAIDLTFEQYCQGGSAALRGDIYWDASDPTAPPGPITPPSGLWKPLAGVVPDVGNYIFLESQPGDYIGAGATYLYTPATAVMTLTAADGHISVSVRGNERWYGNFQAMSSLSQLEVGYYGDLRGYPTHNPAKGGLTWFGEGRGCAERKSWFVIDSVTYDSETLETIEFRFELHCGGGEPALNGAIRWDVNDDTVAPGPVAPPEGLWEPTPGIVPDTGNYIYMDSELGDWVGMGEKYIYTPATAVMTLTAEDGHLFVSVNADEWWSGNFQAMNTLSRLEVGYYSDLQRYPFHNPTEGGLNWSGEGRGCNTLEGWFVVDSVTYDGSMLIAIELRFAQHCEGGSTVLHGAIRWDVNDTTVPPGPVVPAPEGLWETPSAGLPATGNYVYFEGENSNYLYTLADSVIDVEAFSNRLNVRVFGDDDWTSHFEAMSSISQLEVGYYGNLGYHGSHNPAVGGLSWSGPDGICFENAWLVIDSLAYDGSDLITIKLRFELTCGTKKLRGGMRWDVNDPTTPPGPLSPPPAGLWEPAPGTTPDTDVYIYLASDSGDYIGQGQDYVYTPEDTEIIFEPDGRRLEVRVFGTEYWEGAFQAMDTLDYLEVGYYGDLQRYRSHNPTKGGLEWSGLRSCDELAGWFVVDSVTYDGADLSSIELRFEQHCESLNPALRGKIRWVR